MPLVPGYTTVYNTLGAFGETRQSPGLIDMATLVPVQESVIGLPVVNAVQTFGVDNTGATDCTANLQLAINAAAISPQSRIVFLEPGTYLVGSGGFGLLVGAAQDGVWIMGSGSPAKGNQASTTILGAAGFTGTILAFGTNGGGGPQGAHLSDVLIQSSATTPASIGLSAISTQNCTFERVTVSNCKTGINSFNAGSGVAAQNHWIDIYVNVPVLAGGAKGISIDASSGDVHTDYWQHTEIFFGGQAGPATGLYLGATDHIYFDFLYFDNGGFSGGFGSSTCSCIELDYGNAQGQSQWPADCFFEFVEFHLNTGTIPVVTNGTLTIPGGSLSGVVNYNYIYRVGTDNGTVSQLPSPIQYSDTPGLISPFSVPSPSGAQVWDVIQPAFPSSGSSIANPNPFACTVYITVTSTTGNAGVVDVFNRATSGAGSTALGNVSAVAAFGSTNTGTFEIGANQKIGITTSLGSGTMAAWRWAYTAGQG